MQSKKPILQMMNIRYLNFPLFIFLLILCACSTSKNNSSQRPINREAVIKRHNVKINNFDSLSSLSVGNGSFAFTVDPTGLQSYFDYFRKGVILGTQSEWGWHCFPDTAGYHYKETCREYEFYGREVPYAVQWSEPERKMLAAGYFRQNPHRLHLGVIGLKLTHADGSPVVPGDITNISQELDLWSGRIRSSFQIDDIPVQVITYCHQEMDLISAEIISPLIEKGQISVFLKFPYPDGKHVGSGCDWLKPEKHSSLLNILSEGTARIDRKIDSTIYYVTLNYNKDAVIKKELAHYFLLIPDRNIDRFSFSCSFSEQKIKTVLPDFNETEKNNEKIWKAFWSSGGAVDFMGSKDPRAFELERRIVLSQYLTRIQCAGRFPPQETGLTFNSWYGKFHLEMHWWHAVHFALWNRIDLLERSLDYYSSIIEMARKTAEKQGFEGVRWPKMTDTTGRDSPSSVGSFLIWQQPHIIYFAELCYRQHKDIKTLQKYAELVFESAEFMASYAQYDSSKDRYVLGPMLIPAQECFKASKTINPPFELAYWYWGLSKAQEWRERLQMERNPEWDRVISRLSHLPVADNVYLLAESAPDSYTARHTYDHPAVLGALGMLPNTRMVDTSVMHATFDRIWQIWQWDKTWGWDFPLTAMTATRLGLQEKAVDALFMDVQTNTYLINGHNYQDPRLRIYLPGNGGLLAAVALMCAGYDGCETETPGFPHDGSWKVRWENLVRMP